MEKLQGAWAETDPDAEDPLVASTLADKDTVRFGLDYTDGDINKKHCIRCILQTDIPNDESSNGQRVEIFKTKIDVHIFVLRASTSKQKALELQRMENEVRRICKQETRNFGHGITRVEYLSTVPAHDPENYGSDGYWHLRLVFNVNYTMIDLA